MSWVSNRLRDLDNRCTTSSVATKKQTENKGRLVATEEVVGRLEVVQRLSREGILPAIHFRPSDNISDNIMAIRKWIPGRNPLDISCTLAIDLLSAIFYWKIGTLQGPNWGIDGRVWQEMTLEWVPIWLSFSSVAIHLYVLSWATKWESYRHPFWCFLFPFSLSTLTAVGPIGPYFQ